MSAPHDDEPGPVEADLADTTDPLAPDRSGVKKDTIPDARVETAALLDRMMQSARRMPPPAEWKKERATSDGEMFVAYSGEGKLAPGTATPPPVDRVIVMKDLAALARASGARAEDPESVAPGVMESTYVLPRSRSTWGAVALAIGALCVAIIGVLIFASPSRREHGDVRTISSVPSIGVPVVASGAIPAAPPPTAASAPHAELATPVETSAKAPSASPPPAPTPTTILASPRGPVRSLPPGATPSAPAPPEGHKRPDFDPRATPF
jgi:hypothetical protein